MRSCEKRNDILYRPADIVHLKKYALPKQKMRICEFWNCIQCCWPSVLE